MALKTWKTLIISPAVMGIALCSSINPIMAQNLRQTGTNNSYLIAQNDVLNQLDGYSREGRGRRNKKGQVTSVFQLRDVSPRDWAYEALRNLVERYGCIEGYPNRTFRGNRALSRYEFAAGLNACMQQMERLLASSTSVIREDITQLQRLLREFEAELAAIGARVDNLEGRVAFLEENQFSTTTTLFGEVIFAATDSFDGDNPQQESETVLANRVRFFLNTSFDGEDRLVTRIASGNVTSFDSFFAPVGTSIPAGVTTQTFDRNPGGDNDIQIDKIAYFKTYEIKDIITINTYVSPLGADHYDYTPTLHPFFDDFDGGRGALSTFASESPIYRIGGGTALAANFNVGFLEGFLGPSEVTVGYTGGSDAAIPAGDNGFYNGDYAVLTQLNFTPVKGVDIGFTYVNGYHNEDSPIFSSGATSGFGLVGTPFANLANDSFEDALNDEGANVQIELPPKITNTYGVQLSWRINETVNFSGFFAYQDVNFIGPTEDDETWTFGGGFAFPDVGKEGSILGLFAGVQPYLGGESGIFDSLDFEDQNPIHVEVFYKFQLSDNISITPGAIWLQNPQQVDNDDDQIIGTVRTTFTF